ncbi:sensor histidine kinase [Thermomonas flagellata]|uniref:sensor histidine kinase n=1 Tax=Thermomonas flagellata TaxID=2888524 RepID=UPI001F047800|nr:HAMP domain-containing sensor histidine kinase [Thermomonas flagellata]
MRRPLLSTSARLALAVAGAFLLAWVVLGAGVYLTVSTLLLDDVRGLVRSDAQNLEDIHRHGGRALLLQELRQRIEDEGDPDAIYALQTAAGEALVGRLPPGPLPASGTRWVEFLQSPQDPDEHVLRVVAQIRRLHGGDLLLVGQRLRGQDRFLLLMQRAALLALLVAASLGAVVGWLTSRWVARRLQQFNAVADRVGAGELALRVRPDHSGDAFDRLAQRFNGMLDRIGELLEGVRHATDHIAHDLRTPLTRLRNRLELLRDQPQPEPTRAGLDAAIAETDQLLQSFGALLRLARIEAQAPVHDAPVLDLRELAADAAELYTPVAQERGIRIVAALADAGVRGDRDQLFQLLVNLLDNAVKYAPAGSEVALSLWREDAHAVLEVADRGPGIPEADRERVFDRFQRLEAHRGSPGTGLGLSLVRAIVQRHGGRVALLDHQPGLRVRVELPAA